LSAMTQRYQSEGYLDRFLPVDCVDFCRSKEMPFGYPFVMEYPF
jgi:hypothetical protein